MSHRQLELNFAIAVAEALAEPEQANLAALWNALEPELAHLDPQHQLAIAGQAFCDLAEICQRRAECMWEDWRDRYNGDGPIPDDDFLDGLIQKTRRW